jgi:hypothetical protein
MIDFFLVRIEVVAPQREDEQDLHNFGGSKAVKFAVTLTLTAPLVPWGLARCVSPISCGRRAEATLSSKGA